MADLVAEVRRSGLSHVVISGGEPLLQREIGELTGALTEDGLHITVETAGTVAPAFSCDLLSVSPKTANSDPGGKWNGRHRRIREDLAVLRELLGRYPDYQLKFVVRDAADMPEVLTILGELVHVDVTRVQLMAEGRTAEEVARRAPVVAGLCSQYGFRYTPRLHLDLFGGGRGV